MFTKPKTNGASVSSPHRSKEPPSIIAGDMRVLGDLETDGDLQIDGRIDGDLRVFSVTVGQTATVNGAISGQKVVIAGAVNGEIRGDSVKLAATARVVGDIHHESLAIDAGAFLQGLCKRIEDAPSASKTTPVKPTKATGGNGTAKKPI